MCFIDNFYSHLHFCLSIYLGFSDEDLMIFSIKWIVFITYIFLWDNIALLVTPAKRSLKNNIYSQIIWKILKI